MVNIIIGNIIALIASILMVYSGIIKKRKKYSMYRLFRLDYHP